jgi:hypothetical protein
MGVGSQHHAPAAFTGVWLDLGAGLDRCENLASTGILSPDLAARSESLYRLRHPIPTTQIALRENELRLHIAPLL